MQKLIMFFILQAEPMYLIVGKILFPFMKTISSAQLMHWSFAELLAHP
jgi:hypothetical protein